MKKTILLTLLFTVAFTFTTISATVVQDLTATVGAGNTLTISGKISVGNRQVTLQVRNPHNSLDYLNQTTSAVDGTFSFSYAMHSPIQGIYRVALSGEEMQTPYTWTYFYDGKMVSFILGDVNGDGHINAADIVPINRHALGIEIMTCPRMLAAADTNGDGYVNAADIVLINRHALGIELMVIP